MVIGVISYYAIDKVSRSENLIGLSIMARPSERQIAKAMGLSQPRVNQLSAMLPLERRNGESMTAMDAVLMLSVSELMKAANVSGPLAASIIAQLQPEFVHLFTANRNRCWILIEKDESTGWSFTAVRSRKQLQDVQSSQPGANVVELHAVVFEALKTAMTLTREGGNA